MSDSPASDSKRLIVLGSLASGGGFVLRLGTRLLFLYVAGRFYGADTYGAFLWAVAIVELGVALGALECKRLLFKQLDERSEGTAPEFVLLDAALLLVAASTIVAGIIAAAAAIASPGEQEGAAMALLLLAPMVVGQALRDLLLTATRWREKLRYEVFGRSLVEPGTLLAVAYGAYLLGFERSGLIVAYWASTIIGLLYALGGVATCYSAQGAKAYRPSIQRFRKIFAGLPANSLNGALSTFAARLDIYVVGFMLGERAVGIYGMARQLVTPVNAIQRSFDIMLVPVVSQKLKASGAHEAGAEIRSAGRMILSFEFPILILLFALGPLILGSIGPEFVEGYEVLVLLLAAELVQSVYGFGDLLLVFRRPRIALSIVLATIACSIGFAVALIPVFGLPGAALGVLAAVLLRAGLRRWMLAREFDVRSPPGFMAAQWGAGLLSLSLAATILWSMEGVLGWGERSLALAAALALYGGLTWLWMRATGVSLRLSDLRGG